MLSSLHIKTPGRGGGFKPRLQEGPRCQRKLRKVCSLANKSRHFIDSIVGLDAIGSGQSAPSRRFYTATNKSSMSLRMLPIRLVADNRDTKLPMNDNETWHSIYDWNKKGAEAPVFTKELHLVIIRMRYQSHLEYLRYTQPHR